MNKTKIKLSVGLCFLSLSITATEFWVGPKGDNKNPGTKAKPFQTICHAVSKAKRPGDVVTVLGGTYRNEKIIFRSSGTKQDPIILQGEKGDNVTIKGSTVVPADSWKKFKDNIYVAPWKTFLGKWNPKFLDDNPANDPYQKTKKGNRYRGTGKPVNQFFEDGEYLEEVPQISYLKEGSFCIDKAAKKVYVWLLDGANPKLKKMEATNQTHPLLSSWGQDFLIIRNLNFEHCGNGSQGAAAVRISAPYAGHKETGTSSNNIIVEDISVSWSAGSAFSVSGGKNHLVRRCKFNNNGQNGLHVSGVRDSLFEDIEYMQNNLHPGKQFDVGWEAVMKLAGSKNCVFNRIHSAYNHGMGWWVDGPRNDRNTLKNSRIHHNSHQGVRLEIAFRTDVLNNLIYKNGQVGLAISASIGNRIYNNTFVGNKDSAVQIGRVAKWKKEGWEMSSYGNELLNNIVVDNQKGMYHKSWIVHKDQKDTSDNLPREGGEVVKIPYSPNVCDYNLFFLTKHHPHHDKGREFFISQKGRFKKLADFQKATEMDPHSVWADPLFVDITKDDFKLQADSPARNIVTDQVLKLAPKDIVGTPRQKGKIDAGAYQFYK